MQVTPRKFRVLLVRTKFRSIAVRFKDYLFARDFIEF